MNTLSIKALENHLWGAANILRGRMDAADFKQYIFPIVFLKRLCDVYEEEFQIALEESEGDLDYATFAENHRFQIPDEARWKEIRIVTVDIGAKLISAMREIENANPNRLIGIFGDVQWANRNRLPDSLLKDLIEHFSRINLSISNVSQDDLGLAYEYLIKKFADDSGHTAAEFYTNRTVVKLMTMLLDPQPNDSIYDPTCGSGGMLLNSVLHVKEQGKEHRNISLYGQEINIITSAIARMNLFLHGIDDFYIEREDTLSKPRFFKDDKLQTFDVILANPPYSITNWDQTSWIKDPYGRNKFGIPPQGRADYAFLQHIIASMDPISGRAAILFPHGVLFRDEEKSMREKIVETDLIEAIIGLGPNLFYNSTMESCIVVIRSKKEIEKKSLIMFIDAHEEINRRTALSYLNEANLSRILSSYLNHENESGFSKAVTIEEIRSNKHNLNIPLYIANTRYDKYFAEPGHAIEWENEKGVLSNLSVNFEELINEFSNLLVRTHESQEYPLKEIAKYISGNSKDPKQEGIERFVGLEHINSNDIRIQNWGLVENGTSFTKLFFEGNILFGRRRSYLRKAAIADFSGVCSGDIIVLSAVEEIVLPEYLVFLFQSDDFIKTALKKSAGGFSPRVKWKDIQDYKMNIPERTIQKQIAKCLISINDVRQQMIYSIESFSKLTSYYQQLCNTSLVNLNWEL